MTGSVIQLWTLVSTGIEGPKTSNPGVPLVTRTDTGINIV